jgi:hypothetical protein
MEPPVVVVRPQEPFNPLVVQEVRAITEEMEMQKVSVYQVQVVVELQV